MGATKNLDSLCPHLMVGILVYESIVVIFGIYKFLQVHPGVRKILAVCILKKSTRRFFLLKGYNKMTLCARHCSIIAFNGRLAGVMLQIGGSLN
jgi:hypothetical protein